MQYDVRNARLGLMSTRTGGAPRSSRPLALGWKLESGSVTAAEVDALYESVRGAAPARNWASSPTLRALLLEYQAVRRASASSRRPQHSRRGARSARSA